MNEYVARVKAGLEKNRGIREEAFFILYPL